MKLVTYNIRFGLGMDQKTDLGRIAETVRDADIVALQEVERFWKRSGMIDQPEILGKLLQDFYWVYCPAFDVDASERESDGAVVNRRRQFGPMLLSRWPIRSSRIISLPKLGTANHLNMDTGGIECVVDSPAGPLRVYSVHLSAVSTRERLLQIDRLLECHRHAQTNGGAWTGDGLLADPVEAKNLFDQDWSNGEGLPPMPRETIVMGDFNSEPESDEYQQMVGKIDPCYGRVGHFDSFVDSWTVANDRSDDRITWVPDPPERPPGHGLRLDYCFVDPHLGQKVKRAYVDSAAEGSDHRPYWVELEL
jgi:endonuclease/exonuclease/phosphatase family metal-dependent hydrolase